MSRPSQKAAAFTLIELLVVIGIVAILASLLLPALSRAKEAAHTAKCIGNVRQMALGLALYVGDHGNYPTIATAEPLAGSYLPVWFEHLAPCLGNRSNSVTVFHCPSFKLKAPKVGAHPTDPGYPYGYNSGGAGTGSRGLAHGNLMDNGARLPGVKDSSVRVPSRMVAVADSFLAERQPARILAGLPEPQYWPLSQRAKWPGFPREQKATYARHSGRHQVGFCDGHVEKMKHSVLFADGEETGRIWNRDHEPSRPVPSTGR